MNKKEFFAKWTKLPAWTKELVVVTPLITGVVALTFAVFRPPSDMVLGLALATWAAPMVAVILHAVFAPAPKSEEIEAPLPPQPASQSRVVVTQVAAPAPEVQAETPPKRQPRRRPQHRGKPIVQRTITPKNRR